MKNFRQCRALTHGLMLFFIAILGFSCKRHKPDKDFGYLDDDDYRRSFMAAAQGDQKSAEKLASYYFHFKRDACLGFYWRERAAILGNTKAQEDIRLFFRMSDLEAYREVLGRTNTVEENALFNVINTQP